MAEWLRIRTDEPVDLLIASIGEETLVVWGEGGSPRDRPVPFDPAVHDRDDAHSRWVVEVDHDGKTFLWRVGLTILDLVKDHVGEVVRVLREGERLDTRYTIDPVTARVELILSLTIPEDLASGLRDPDVDKRLHAAKVVRESVELPEWIEMKGTKVRLVQDSGSGVGSWLYNP